MVKNKQGNITMTKEQEDKIIAQAQDILERRMAVEMNIKINLQNVMYYGAYLLGAQMVANELIPYVMKNYRGDDKAYIKAELDMITSSKRNMQLWLDKTPMRYRNHKRDKNGKLESCECYFVEYRNIITEVK
jgi:hypothetical protein